MTLNLVVPKGKVRFVFFSGQKNNFRSVILGEKKYARLTQKQIEEVRASEKINTPKFLYSKLQITQLINTLESIKNIEVRNPFVEDLYLYASNQSRFSSAYYKLE